ncbi:MAG TPA: hypothetical protein VIE91_04200 [Methylophilaceae bacterium]|jgi:hypothetical protein
MRAIATLRDTHHFAKLNATLRPGVNERMTQTVHSARQGMSEADNDVSAIQWGRQ